MKVALVGLGKLGLPVAYAMASRGISVYGHDPAVWDRPINTDHEEGLAEAIKASRGRMHFCTLAEAIQRTDGVVFVAVQTPHEPRFEGVTPLPDDRADFDYSHLIKAVQQVAHTAVALGKNVTISVISTVLPGTMEREIVPLLPDGVRLVYNPSFIAMGTTVQDFLDPEFVLLGGSPDDQVSVIDVYARVFADGNEVFPDDPAIGPYSGPRMAMMSIRDAELTKVAYNTFIGLKIAFANTLMEICHKTGGDVDQVTGALKLAHRRLISGAYMDGGMGDGGGCHPRDNIALSWLAQELDLSHDLFYDAMKAREDQAEWLAYKLDEAATLADAGPLPVGILGIAYKPESHITTGSAALLVRELLLNPDRYARVATYDSHVQGHGDFPAGPHAWLVGCKHPEFADLEFPEGSVVIDPFRYIPDQEGVEVIRVGQWVPEPTAASRSTTRVQAA